MMIELIENVQCCGCSACVEKCPKNCIAMKEDEEGFLYPVIDKGICINCGLCEKVCPMIDRNTPHLPIKVYASINKDDNIRLTSSSGGIFSLLAEKVISRGGVVFGACFDDSWEVKLAFTKSKAGLSRFRGSKYVQARVENTYMETECFLKQGYEVLYSGTPCQIAGLKKFLRRSYEKLLTIDFVCHGVPSPKVWRKYLEDTIAHQIIGKKTVSFHSKLTDVFIENIEFRSKITGWKNYSFTLTLSEVRANGEKNTVLLSSVYSDNIYMRAFLSDLILRPSCYKCPFKSGKSGSDITIADFWGIDKCAPEMDDDKGTGLVLINTQKGLSFFPYDKAKMKECTYNEATIHNPAALSGTIHPHINRAKFFVLLNKEKFALNEIITKMLSYPFKVRVKNYIIRSICYHLHINKL